jgi:hypothetical protein
MLQGLGWTASLAPHPSISSNPRSPSPRSDCASTHGRPTQIYHQQLDALGGFGCSLERWNVEVFEDGIGGNALDAVMADLASNFSQGSGPGVR